MTRNRTGDSESLNRDSDFSGGPATEFESMTVTAAESIQVDPTLNLMIPPGPAAGPGRAVMVAAAASVTVTVRLRPQSVVRGLSDSPVTAGDPASPTLSQCDSDS